MLNSKKRRPSSECRAIFWLSEAALLLLNGFGGRGAPLGVGIKGYFHFLHILEKKFFSIITYYIDL